LSLVPARTPHCLAQGVHLDVRKPNPQWLTPWSGRRSKAAPPAGSPSPQPRGGRELSPNSPGPKNPSCPPFPMLGQPVSWAKVRWLDQPLPGTHLVWSKVRGTWYFHSFLVPLTAWCPHPSEGPAEPELECCAGNSSSFKGWAVMSSPSLALPRSTSSPAPSSSPLLEPGWQQFLGPETRPGW
jgi:hypothetical protein